MAEKLNFPDGFLWGAATASYQIEGATTEDGRSPSIWDTFSATPGKVVNGDTGAVACDHYHRYPEDIALMKRIGLHAYRFSIAWPRILPQGTGAVNQAGLDFYNRLVDALLEAGIQPWATLYHWDLPQILQDRGGWPSRDIIDAFTEYADVVTRNLGDRVKNWMTFNEPWVFTYLGYTDGKHAPGHHSWEEYLKGAHHLLIAHARTMKLIKANAGEEARAGIVLNLAWADPASDSAEDIAASQRYMSFQNRWFLDPLYRGSYPADMLELYNDILPDIQPGDMDEIAGKPDFLGINYYHREVVAHDAHGDRLQLKFVFPPGEYTAMDWEVSPHSLYQLLKHVQTEYAPGAIYITENGAAFDDVPEGDAVHDARRVNFYKAYIAKVHQAMQEGVPVKGYFAWSLLDNFEWAEGYAKRFGITYIDYNSQQRILKDSGKWYSQTISNNGFTLE